jgi:hypothetical protein
MEKTMKKMIEVKSGIEHLADKLHHLKGVSFQERFRFYVNDDFSDEKSSTNNGYFNTIE